MSSGAAGTRPNFVVILADDLGSNDLYYLTAMNQVSNSIAQKIALIADDEWSVRTYIEAVLESDGIHLGCGLSLGQSAACQSRLYGPGTSGELKLKHISVAGAQGGKHSVTLNRKSIPATSSSQKQIASIQLGNRVTLRKGDELVVRLS